VTAATLYDKGADQMTEPPGIPEVGVEDAFHIIVRDLHDRLLSGRGLRHNYGYDLYLPYVMGSYVGRHTGEDTIPALERHREEIQALSPAFYGAAWELCRRGILRPGVWQYRAQVTDEGSGGNGYSLTPLGKEWLEHAGAYDYVPVEPARFALMLDRYAPRFGPAFKERAQEAIRSYGALAYLACCAMCGAAAESIVLALAVEKRGGEQAVLNEYLASGGRTRIERSLVGQQPDPIKREFTGYTSLLKYWRDNAAHGAVSGITDNEAYTSLAVLLRFAQFAEDRWSDLTA
jgi:hypothetical protein